LISLLQLQTKCIGKYNRNSHAIYDMVMNLVTNLAYRLLGSSQIRMYNVTSSNANIVCRSVNTHLDSIKVTLQYILNTANGLLSSRQRITYAGGPVA
jgi:hypothetical protein